MAIERLEPLSHYSLANQPTIYDEDSLTALELCARTASKMNETIELLLKECREQNLTIDQAVAFMKDRLDESTAQLLHEMAQNGELDILTQENFNGIRKNITTTVNVKEFGAVGDGVADDTPAVLEAMQAGTDVYFPAGTYLLTSPITISEFKHIHGEGMGKTIIKYTGPEYLFKVSTYYRARPIIERLEFVGTDDNSFMQLHRSAWGVSVCLRDFNIQRFNVEVFNFASAFACVIENGDISSHGVIKFTTHNGLITDTNFNNCNIFHQVFIHTDVTERTPVMFDLYNVRGLFFNECQLERSALVFKGAGKVTHLRLEKCWIEYNDCLVDFGEGCNNPTTIDCIFVGVDKYLKNATKFDYVSGAPYVRDVSGASSMIDTMKNETIVFDSRSMSGDGDSYSSYFTPYLITTQNADFMMPLNARSTETLNTLSASIDLAKHLRYTNAKVIWRGFVYMTWANSDYRIYEFLVIKPGGSYKVVRSECVYDATWTGSAGKDAVVTIAMDGGTLNVTSTIACNRIYIGAEFNRMP